MCQHVQGLESGRHCGCHLHLCGYACRTSFVANDRLINDERTCRYIARGAHQNGVVLHFTDAVIRTGALIREGAHVHTHALQPRGCTSRNVHIAGLLTEAGGLEHEFRASEDAIIVPIHPSTPAVAQEEGAAGVNRDPVSCSRVYIGYQRSEIAIAIVVAARIVDAAELDPGNIERIPRTAIRRTIGLGCKTTR